MDVGFTLYAVFREDARPGRDYSPGVPDNAFHPQIAQIAQNEWGKSVKSVQSVDARPGLAVEIFVHDGLAVAFARTPPSFPQTAPAGQVLRELSAHQQVVERLMDQVGELLPVKFGTWVASEAQVRQFLESGAGAFKRGLDALEGKVEVEVMALWADMPRLFREIGEEDQIVELKRLASKLRLGQAVKAALDRRSDETARRIVVELERTAARLAQNERRDDAMILNAGLLIERKRQDELDRKLDEMDRAFEGRVNFRRVGPLPAYSFSTVEVETPCTGKILWARRQLDLPPRASWADVREAYRRASEAGHPDRRNGPTGDFERSAEAYRILKEYVEQVKLPLEEETISTAPFVRLRTAAELRGKSQIPNPKSQ